MTQPTHVSPSDLAMFTKAQGAFTQAQAVMQFTGSHLGETYGLSQRDTFNMQTGEIARFVEPTLPIE